MTDTWVQTTSLDAGQAFKMGRGSSRSVLGPAMGMSTITLNNSVFQADDEFPQHRHDISEDCMLVLRGAVSFRQTDAYTRIGELDFAWVPVAEVHGTVNTSGEEAELISFQSPPDVRLYAGDRDVDSASAPVVDGPVASRVESLEMGVRAGDADAGITVHEGVGPATGAEHLDVALIELEPGARLALGAGGREQVCVLLEGRAAVESGTAVEVGARDVVYGIPSTTDVLRAVDRVRLIRATTVA